VDKKREAALAWWIKHEHPSKDEWLEDRTEWEALQKYLHGEGFQMLLHKECKGLIRSLDKSGYLTCGSLEEARAKEAKRNHNLAAYGDPDGIDGILSRASRQAEAMNGGQSHDYREYIKGRVWADRSLQYLNVNCLLGDVWFCELCGRTHSIHAKPRSIQVHHLHYNDLNGEETDWDLLGVCEFPCHKLADICRTIVNGSMDWGDIGDRLKPLFVGL
jgi:hypothetical protein